MIPNPRGTADPIRREKPAPLAARPSRAAVSLLVPLLLLAAQTLPAQTPSCAPPPALASQLHDAPTAAAWSRLGSWFGQHHRPACAAGAYQKALALAPRSARNAYLLGLSLDTAGTPQQAVAPLRQSLLLDPRWLRPRLLLAAVLQQTGDRPGAELQWRAALALDPHASMALENLSSDLLADRNYSSVIEWLGPLAATALLPVPAAVNLSVAYTRSGLPDDAASLLRRTLHAHPDSLPVAEALAAVLVLQSRVQPAVDLLTAAAAKYPKNLQLRILLLRALVLERSSAAPPLARRLLAAHPRQWELLYLTGLLQQQAGNWAAARTRYQESLAQNSDYPEAHFQLGVVLDSLRDYASAEKQLRQAITLGYNSPKVYFELGRALHATGQTAEARAEFERYQQAQQAEANETLASAKSQQGDREEAARNYPLAATDFRQALALDPREPLLAYKLAMALDKSGDRAGERAALHQALEDNPRMAEAQNQLGYLDSMAGSTAAAIRRFQLAVSANPGYTKAWMNLAAQLCLEARWQDARSALAHVLELDPSSVPAHTLLQRLNQIDPQP